jgi:hypothetical protein
MCRTILAIVTALLAVTTVFASAAEACISCEHVPVVARSSSTSHGAKRHKNRRVYRSTTKRKARTAKKRIVRRKTTAKKRIVRRKTTAKKRIVRRKTTAKKVETAKTAPVKSDMDNQNSTISTASLRNSYAGCKTLSVGCVVAKARPSEKTKNLGCKKFLPSVGMTLTVPCKDSTISTVSLSNDETIETEIEAKDEPKTSGNVACKKFFPAVGLTLTVPCE